MKYYKTLKLYKCSNLQYNEETEQAHSYEWYQIAGRFNGQMIVNNYGYSSTTQRHAYKIRRLFDDLGIEYITLEAPRGLQNLEIAKSHYQALIENLKAKIENPRSRKHLLADRAEQLAELENKLALVEGLIK